MQCPYCAANKDQLKVIDSRTADSGGAIRRRRECLRCDKRFTTYERVEPGARLTVIKKDFRRVPWDRRKILVGLENATFKRPVDEAALVRIADEVEEEAQRAFEKEVPSVWIGEQVMRRLREVDQVAYVRYASVYREFGTIDDVMEEVREMIARRSDDPDQGELFAAAEKRKNRARRA